MFGTTRQKSRGVIFRQWRLVNLMRQQSNAAGRLWEEMTACLEYSGHAGVFFNDPVENGTPEFPVQ